MARPVTSTLVPSLTTYEQWMEGEGIPIVEAVGGIEDIKEIERRPWGRTGGKGAFIYLQGMKEGGLAGMYVAEIPPGKTLDPERHIYEEMIYILKGQGATEIWQEGQPKKIFEWSESSFFALPLNAWHRLHNGGREPVIFLAITTAPVVMDLFHNENFVFGNGFTFEDRYRGEEDFFQVGPKVERDTTALKIIWMTNFVPDLRTAFVDPSASYKAVGGRTIGYEMAGNVLGGHIGEWPVGIYHKAHFHGPGAILLGLRSKGYVLMWRKELGVTPFKDGHGDQVIRFNWKEGSVYSPGDGWFHQHFNTGSVSARHIAFHTDASRYKLGIRPRIGFVQSMKEGGTVIDQEDEDPAIRREFEAALEKEGIGCQMPPAGQGRQ